jgi:hypothetical protein
MMMSKGIEQSESRAAVLLAAIAAGLKRYYQAGRR